MRITMALRTLGRNDLRLIGRDSFLSGMIVFLLLVAVGLRFALPWLQERIAASPEFGFDLAELYPMLISYVAMFLAAMLSGIITGFMLLDERDDNTLKALLVTPLPLNHYIAHRVATATAIAFCITIAEVLIINQAVLPLWQLIPLAAGGALIAPAVTLFFATFAENKVQGFALNKILGGLGLLLVAAWFVPEPWQYLFGLFPPYWLAKAYWAAYAGDVAWLLYLALGVILNCAMIAVFIRRFQRVAYR